MVQKLDGKMQLLFLGWNVISTLKTYSMKIAHTLNLQP